MALKPLPPPYNNYAVDLENMRVFSRPRQAKSSFTWGLVKRRYPARWLKRRKDRLWHLHVDGGMVRLSDDALRALATGSEGDAD